MLDSLSALLGSGAVGLLIAFLAILVLAFLVLLLARKRRRHSDALVAGHRLTVVDQVQIDDTRRLVLIQRDEVQHLVILGGGSDFLVESGIGSRLQSERAPAHIAPPAGEAPRPEPRRAPPRTIDTARPQEAAPLRREPGLHAPSGTETTTTREDTPSNFRADAVALDVEPPLSPRNASPQPVVAQQPRTGVANRATDPNRRVAVKLDPQFAGMVEQLEETLRRPAAEAAQRQARQAGLAAAPEVSPVSVAHSEAREAAPPVAPARPSNETYEVNPVEIRSPYPQREAEVIPQRPTTGDAPEAAAVPPVNPADRPAPGLDSAFDREMADLLGRKRRN